jgi:hypothetical protein
LLLLALLRELFILVLGRHMIDVIIAIYLILIGWNIGRVIAAILWDYFQDYL